MFSTKLNSMYSEIFNTNKKIYIVVELFCSHIHGSFIDCLDMYYNMRKYNINCELIILIYFQYINTLRDKLNQTYTPLLVKDIMRHIHTNISNINSNDIIICKYESLKSGIIDYNKYKNIYIINDWNLTMDCVNNCNINIDNIDNIKGVFGSPFFKQFSNKTIIDYMSFSQFRLDNMKILHRLPIFNDYPNYDELKRQQYFNIHQYNKLLFQRRYEGWIEIKGKLIFEFRYFNKDVHYSPKYKTRNDGLTDYLQLFDIDDNIEQDVVIPKEEIIEKLVG